MYVVKRGDSGWCEVGYYITGGSDMPVWVTAAGSFAPIVLYGICSWLNGGAFPVAPIGFTGTHDWTAIVYSMLLAVNPGYQYPDDDHSADDD